MRKIQNKARNYILLAVVVSLLCAAPLLALAAEQPSVTTYGVRNISMTSANLQGYVGYDGGCGRLVVWFEYGKDTSYGQKTAAGSQQGIGYFSADIYDLSPCATYHFRAVAKNNTNRVAYGSDRTIKTQCASFDVQTSVKNLTRGDEVWYKSLNAEPGDELLYQIKVASTGDVLIQNLMLASDLPDNIVYQGELKIDGRTSRYNIVAGSINLGNLFPEQTKIITFKAKVGTVSALNFGRNNLVHSVVAYTTDFSDIDTCTVQVTREGVAGVAAVAGAATVAPTYVATGITNSISGSVLLPLALALALVWVFRSRLICFEEWAHKRRVRADQFRTKRKLARKIAKLQ